MNENLDLTEILKDCPDGTELYSPMFGDVKLVKVSQCEGYPIEVKLSDNATDAFTKDGRAYIEYNGECMLFPSKDQRDWSKFKIKQSKFDPKTLQPFDKVLARDNDGEFWRCAFLSYRRENEKITFRYVTTDSAYKYCIPYNDDTKHLVGTTDEAPEFYRYWEE